MSLLSLTVKLKPAPAEQAEVQTSAQHLVGTLNAKAEEALIPTPLSCRYIGSYARDTKPSPVDDVDILYVVGEAAIRENNWHIITKNTFAYAAEDYEADRNISSLLLLNRIKKAIAETYPNSELRRNHEVVNIQLSSYKRSFDLVPAWHVPDGKYFLIPQGEQKHKWKKTNPFQDKAILDSADQKTQGTARPAILIMKHWFRRKKVVTPRSYHLEAIAYNIFMNLQSPSTTLFNSLAILLNNFAYKDLLASCPDPAGLSEPLTSGLSSQDIAKIISEGKSAARVLYQNGEAKFLEEIDEE